jgi:hypothetical protein
MPSPKLASSPQLWRLNQQRRLKVVDAADSSITATQAHDLLSELAAARPFNATDRFVELDEASSASTGNE